MKLLYSYICLIFLLSLLPTEVVGSAQIQGLDKVIHFLEYFLLGVIFQYSIKKIIITDCCFILLVPLIDEFIIQKFSGRNVDIYDFMFDIIGLIIGIIIKINFINSK